MLIFGIDTCCMAATAAIMDDDKLVAQTVLNSGRTHSQKMMPQITEMFRQAELTPGQIDAFAAAVGPGSFTGVRIGVATAKALAQAVQKPCVAVSTLEALAENLVMTEGLICPILDARRDQVYNALFRGGQGLERLCDDRALGLAELLAECKTVSETVLFCGDGVLVHREAIERELGEKARFAPRALNLNLAASVAEIGYGRAARGETLGYDQLVPCYVRLSQAERERLEREKSEGKERKTGEE